MKEPAKYDTQYVESEAILAASEKDGGYLLHLALNMTLSERRSLREAAIYLESNFSDFLNTDKFPEPDL